MVICGTIAGYNAIEGLALILSTFRQYKGLYFWSLLVADLGILIYMVFVTLWFFDLTIRLAALLPLYVGWICMVTGQSFVLYSRLGIVLGPQRTNILRGAKWMIITDAVVFHTSTIGETIQESMLHDSADITKVIALCSFYAPNPKPASRAYYYMERLHITAFGLQELVLSALYIWAAVNILRTSLRPRLRRIVVELITINSILVFIDVAGITLEYCNLFFFEVAFKMASYSIKLKLEFAILSKLMLLSGGDETTRERDSRGDSLVFPSDIVSTAMNKGVNPPMSAALTYGDPSIHAHHEAGNTTAIKRHRRTQSEGANLEQSEEVETYADVLRSMSTGH